MAYNTTYISDYGWVLKVDCGQDISTASTYQIVVEKPDGTEATITGALSGTDYITWTSTQDYFTVTGTYTFRSKVTFGSAVLYGDRFTIRMIA